MVVGSLLLPDAEPEPEPALAVWSDDDEPLRCCERLDAPDCVEADGDCWSLWAMTPPLLVPVPEPDRLGFDCDEPAEDPDDEPPDMAPDDELWAKALPAASAMPAARAMRDFCMERCSWDGSDGVHRAAVVLPRVVLP